MRIPKHTIGSRFWPVRTGMLLPLFFAVACLEQANQAPVAAPDPSPPGTSNTPPRIQGTPPAAVKVGEPYSFTPTASDPDGDTLQFRIQNRPNWASFDTATGEMSGVPTLGDIGVYQNVEISVTDGKASAALPDFAVTVDQVGQGSATLSWQPPTENTDGSALTTLAGYNLYFGKSPGNYPNRVRIDNPGINTYVVENLEFDTYYFVITAYNSAGVESAYSNMATKVVN